MKSIPTDIALSEDPVAARRQAREHSLATKCLAHPFRDRGHSLPKPRRRRKRPYKRSRGQVTPVDSEPMSSTSAPDTKSVIPMPEEIASSNFDAPPMNLEQATDALLSLLSYASDTFLPQISSSPGYMTVVDSLATVRSCIADAVHPSYDHLMQHGPNQSTLISTSSGATSLKLLHLRSQRAATQIQRWYRRNARNNWRKWYWDQMRSHLHQHRY